jgi:hypothetical protein
MWMRVAVFTGHIPVSLLARDLHALELVTTKKAFTQNLAGWIKNECRLPVYGAREPVQDSLASR